MLKIYLMEVRFETQIVTGIPFNSGYPVPYPDWVLDTKKE